MTLSPPPLNNARIGTVSPDVAGVATDVAPPVESPRPYVAPIIAGKASATLVPLAVASALFMEFIDSTALSTALPTLSRAFHSDPIHLKLALTSYLLALAVFAPASGWVADRFGARRVFVTAMGVFLAGSIACGLSHSLGHLVAARLLQGAGGAMMTPVGRLIVVGSAPRERLVAAMAWFTTPALVGPMIGPPLAGFVLGVADWPWIFFLNIPVAVLGIAAVLRWVPNFEQAAPGRFDTWGFALSAAAITGVVVLAETGGVGLVPAPFLVALAAAVILAGVLFVRHIRRTAKPILNLALLRYPTYRASVVGGTLVRLGLGATPFLMPLLLQVGLGWSPVRAGLVTIATAMGALLCKPLAAPLIRRLGFRTVLLASLTLTAALTAIPAVFRADTPIPAMMLALLAGGFVRSMQFTSSNTIAYAETPRDQTSQASTLSTVIQQVGMSLGVSFGALTLHLARGSADAPLTPDRFVLPFVLVGATTLLALPVYWRLDPQAGAGISGR